MSSREWIFRLEDILQSIKKIECYLKGLTLSQFKKNDLVIDAVIRNLEIIGEASKNIPSNIQKTYPTIPWEIMYGMRNILIHEYFGVDSQIVWHTAKRNLPQLEKQLNQMMKEIKR